MSKKNSVPVFEPEKMQDRLEGLGYNFFSFSNEVLDRTVSATTLERMARSGYASQNAVDKIVYKAPAMGSYILFGTSPKGKDVDGKMIPEDVELMLMGMASYIRTTSTYRSISRKKLLKRLKALASDQD